MVLRLGGKMSKINLDEIKKIIELFDELKINKFRIKYKKFEIEVDKHNKQNISHNNEHQKLKELNVNSDSDTKEANLEEDSSINIITSPIPGTFYRSPAPDEEPFINKGDKIKVGDVLGIVEAMKVMNKIESDVSGEVLEILHEDGKPVEYGTKLIKIKLS